MAHSMLNKIALVTGAGSGIGRSTALAFANAGYCVVVSDINEKGGHETVDMISGDLKGESASFFKCDVTKEGEVISLMKKIKKHYGRLNAAFNNAGIDGPPGTTIHTTLENWNKVVDVNLNGTFLTCKHELPLMMESGGGSIVNCASVYGKRGLSWLPAYVAAKHGILGFTKSLALDVVEHSIRVNAVSPGLIATPMVEKREEEGLGIREQIAAHQPMGRLGRVEEVAEAVVWLCSESAGFITGTSLDVDGGWIAQ